MKIYTQRVECNNSQDDGIELRKRTIIISDLEDSSECVRQREKEGGKTGCCVYMKIIRLLWLFLKSLGITETVNSILYRLLCALCGMIRKLLAKSRFPLIISVSDGEIRKCDHQRHIGFGYEKCAKISTGLDRISIAGNSGMLNTWTRSSIRHSSWQKCHFFFEGDHSITEQKSNDYVFLDSVVDFDDGNVLYL